MIITHNETNLRLEPDVSRLLSPKGKIIAVPIGAGVCGRFPTA